jgi:predicted nucleic acid-binding protein
VRPAWSGEFNRHAITQTFGAFAWHGVDANVAELAGALGRQWLKSHSGIDSPDLAIAATPLSLGAELVTMNVRHFPMFPGLRAPYR